MFMAITSQQILFHLGHMFHGPGSCCLISDLLGNEMPFDLLNLSGWVFGLELVVTSLGWIATLETCFRDRSGESTFNVKDDVTFWSHPPQYRISKYKSKVSRVQSSLYPRRTLLILEYDIYINLGPYACLTKVYCRVSDKQIKKFAITIRKGPYNIEAWPVRSAGNFCLNAGESVTIVNYLLGIDFCSFKEANLSLESSAKQIITNRSQSSSIT